MSKNPNNNLNKGNKSQHKRNNSNSYNMNTTSNINTLNTVNNMNITQNDTVMNTTSNIPGGLNNNLLTNLNQSKLQGDTSVQYTAILGGGTSPNILTNLNNTQNNFTETKQEDLKALQQKVECVGKVPTARFGHTIVLVSAVKVICFGGAVGDTRNFQFTNDTYVLNLMTKIWTKLEVNGTSAPCPRAAHASCSNDNLQMVVYGGSTGSNLII
jgi:hypothetical protein